VLWDKRQGVIVNNESSEIIRMMNCSFNALSAKSSDYYPEELRLEIESVNTRLYDTLNNGVYKAGFTTSQMAYEEAIAPLFETLDWLESLLSSARYLVGNRLTEADIRLFTTLVRFDSIYSGTDFCSGVTRARKSWPQNVGDASDLAVRNFLPKISSPPSLRRS
jgi:glutathionyl-hydroquinone reductase